MTKKEDPRATLIKPSTIRFERLLPGPVERVWAYLTESKKRATWLAAGEFDLRGVASLLTGTGRDATGFELPFIVQGPWDDPIVWPDAQALINRSGAAASEEVARSKRLPRTPTERARLRRDSRMRNRSRARASCERTVPFGRPSAAATSSALLPSR